MKFINIYHTISTISTISMIVALGLCIPCEAVEYARTAGIKPASEANPRIPALPEAYDRLRTIITTTVDLYLDLLETVGLLRLSRPQNKESLRQQFIHDLESFIITHYDALTILTITLGQLIMIKIILDYLRPQIAPQVPPPGAAPLAPLLQQAIILQQQPAEHNHGD